MERLLDPDGDRGPADLLLWPLSLSTCLSISLVSLLVIKPTMCIDWPSNSSSRPVPKPSPRR